jgi:uncharacterized membrane protein (DUF373 family)
MKKLLKVLIKVIVWSVIAGVICFILAGLIVYAVENCPRQFETVLRILLICMPISLLFIYFYTEED